MIPVIIILSGFIIAFVLEAKHDYEIISNELVLFQMLGEPDRSRAKENSREWHIYDWWYLAVLSFAITGTLVNLTGEYIMLLLLPLIAALKVLVFNTRLNRYMGLKWHHIGVYGFEGMFVGREKLYYVLNAIIFLSLLAILFYWLNFH